MLTDNEKGYLVYCWEQKGYNFIPLKYNPTKDYTSYLHYYSDENKNKELIEILLKANNI